MKHFVPTDQHRANNKKISIYTKTTREIFSASSTSSLKTVLNTTKLDIVLTSKGLLVYGTWSKDKLLQLLINRLKHSIYIQSSSAEISIDTVNDKRLRITVHNGVYSVYVIRKLQKNGMSVFTIVKAMKLGLVNLSDCELVYFKTFKVDPYILEFKEMWSKRFSEELISKLKTTGLKTSECWNIIVHGIRFQQSHVLCRLTLSGIDVPGILNWKLPINAASTEIIQFLSYIGIEEDVIQLVEQYGIDDETEQMLTDLGLNEMKKICSNMEEIICKCNLIILESDTNSLDTLKSICKTCDSRSTSSLANISNYFERCTRQDQFKTKKETVDELAAQRNDYLRQNLMVALAWAMARTLIYKPSDPVHYMAYQLLRWKHDNVIQMEKDSIQKFVALATIAMDRKLIMRKISEEQMENIPRSLCKDYQELRRVKERCWEYITKPLVKHESCEFPQMCDSCELDAPH